MKSRWAAAWFLFVGCGVSSAQRPSLDGQAFRCSDGSVVGFQGDQSVYCLQSSRDEATLCGHYQYTSNGNHQSKELTGFSTSLGAFHAVQVEHSRDGRVVSFQTNQQIECHCVSLHWSNYSHTDFLGMACPPVLQQDKANDPQLVETRNHFSFGHTGDVALRSSTVIRGREGDTGTPPVTTLRDFYGIFQYNHENDRIDMYFGPQPHLDALWVLEGSLSTEEGELLLDSQEISAGFACVHDQESQIPSTRAFVTQLGSFAKTSRPPDRTLVRDTWDSTAIAIGHASATAAAALGVRATLDRSTPAYGLAVGWGLAAVANFVTKQLDHHHRLHASSSSSENHPTLSDTLKKGATIQRMLCWAGSAVCVAASAASAVQMEHKLGGLFANP